MIDNKGRLFGKVNIVDLCIVLILVVAVCATVFKFGFSRYGGINGMTTTPPINVEYVLKISGVRDFTADSVKKGDKLYNEDNNTYLGVISDVEVKNATEYVTKADGTVQMSVNPDRYDVYVTVECNAKIKKGTYYVVLDDDEETSTEICEYMYLKVYTSKFSSMAQIYDVSQK